MTQEQRLENLIQILATEQGRPVPRACTPEEKEQWFRALCNVRPPWPANPAFLRLQDAYLNSLRLVAANSYTSVAFPAISTGVYGYPRAAAAEIAVKTVSEFITRHALPEQVYFVCYDEENAHLYERLLTQQGDE